MFGNILDSSGVVVGKSGVWVETDDIVQTAVGTQRPLMVTFMFLSKLLSTFLEQFSQVLCLRIKKFEQNETIYLILVMIK